MMRARSVLVATAGISAAVVLSGCGGGSAAPAVPATVSVAASQPVTSQSPTPTAQPTLIPLSFYAAQYLRICKPYNKAVRAFNKGYKVDPTNAYIQAGATHLGKVLSAEETALRRAQWPSNVNYGVIGLRLDDATYISDLDDLAVTTNATIASAIQARRLDDNVIRADLGLKAATS